MVAEPAAKDADDAAQKAGTLAVTVTGGDLRGRLSLRASASVIGRGGSDGVMVAVHVVADGGQGARRRLG